MIGDRTAAVFGGTGFIGRYVVRLLAHNGWRVIVASRHPDRALPMKTAGVVGQIVPVPADVRDDASVEAALHGAAAVVSLVGILYERGRQRFDAIHVAGAASVARAAAAAGVERLVHVSAIGASANSASAYARTKAAGEKAVRAAFPGATILRPSVVFGPEDAFFNLFAGLARNAPFLPLIGGGKTRFQPVYVGDLAAAIVQAADDGRHAGMTYELGGPRVYTFRELMTLTLEVAMRKRPLVTIPWGVARIQAKVMGLMPKPLLTLDQLEQLRVDNVVSPGAAGFDAFGIVPTPAEIVLPTYLDRFRPGGRFAIRRAR
jgi:uncharacterized protein YbjT (DUF2867 family)